MMLVLYASGLALLGVSVGVFSTGLGLGGGVLMVPVFITLAPDMDMHTAKGTSLFVILLVAMTGLPRVWKLQAHKPPLRVAVFIASGALLGGYFGAAITVRLPEMVLLLLFLAFIVYLMVRLATGNVTPVPRHRPTCHNGLLFSAGLLAGAVGSATGTGGGSVLAPLILLAGLLPHTQLVYVSNQVMIATSLASAPAHLFAEQHYDRFFTVGHISLGLVPIILLTAQIGVVLGARLNHRLRAGPRRRLLAVVLSLVALRMAFHLIFW